MVVAHLCTFQCCSGWNYKVPYSMPNYIESQESKKAAAHASYSASPEKKRAASRASYRPDPEEKRAASRVASHASCLPPRVFLFKAYR